MELKFPREDFKDFVLPDWLDVDSYSCLHTDMLKQLSLRLSNQFYIHAGNGYLNNNSTIIIQEDLFNRKKGSELSLSEFVDVIDSVNYLIDISNRFSG